jgi:hypothetical protein
MQNHKFFSISYLISRLADGVNEWVKPEKVAGHTCRIERD